MASGCSSRTLFPAIPEIESEEEDSEKTRSVKKRLFAGTKRPFGKVPAIPEQQWPEEGSADDEAGLESPSNESIAIADHELQTSDLSPGDSGFDSDSVFGEELRSGEPRFDLERAYSFAEPVPDQPDSGPPPSMWGLQLSGEYSTGDGLSISQLGLSASIAIPLDPPRRMLMVAPSFSLATVDVGNSIDVPKELYSLGVNAMWMEQLNDRWGLQVALSPSVRGDVDSLDQAVRFSGMAMLTWECRPDVLQFSFGAVYTGRDDLPVLPMAGVQWTPNEDWQIEIGLPAPRIARRVWVDENGLAAWVYVTGGIGGGTWNVRRADGRSDELSINEYRVAIGAELGQGPQKKMYVEVGLNFGRKLEYEKGGESISFGEGLSVQAGWDF